MYDVEQSSNTNTSDDSYYSSDSKRKELKLDRENLPKEMHSERKGLMEEHIINQEIEDKIKLQEENSPNINYIHKAHQMGLDLSGDQLKDYSIRRTRFLGLHSKYRQGIPELSDTKFPVGTELPLDNSPRAKVFTNNRMFVEEGKGCYSTMFPDKKTLFVHHSKL